MLRAALRACDDDGDALAPAALDLAANLARLACRRMDRALSVLAAPTAAARAAWANAPPAARPSVAALRETEVLLTRACAGRAEALGANSEPAVRSARLLA